MEKIKLEQEIHSTKIAWIKTQKDRKTIMFEAPMSPLNQTIRIMLNSQLVTCHGR